MSEPTFILRGIAGSTAHGLAGPDSDEDLYGVFSWPSSAFYPLEEPADSLVSHEPQDSTYHELKKFLKLALRSNPTVLELLWLNEYTDVEPGWGETLVAIRSAFLSEKLVRDAYLGYAHSQFTKLHERGDGSFDSNTRSRAPKHAKHLFRLLEAGYDLLTTGTMSVKVKDRARYEDILRMDKEQWTHLYRVEQEKFQQAKSILPEKPDREAVNTYLIHYREAH